MKCNQIDVGAGTILQIEGTLDAESAGDLAPVIGALVAGGQPLIVIDLSSLRLIDRFGAASLVSFCVQVRARGGEIRAVGLRQQPLAIFRLLRLDACLSPPAQSQPAAVAA